MSLNISYKLIHLSVISYFKVNFNFKPLTKSLTEGTLVLPQTILEDSEDEDEDCEFVIEYVTDSEEEE